MAEETAKETRAIGTLFSNVLKDNASSIRHFGKQVGQDEDPDNLHKLRVAYRRVSSLLLPSKPFLNLPKSIEQDLKIILRQLGKLRDTDIIQSHIQLTESTESTEAKHLRRVKSSLKTLRKKRLKKISTLIHSKRYKTLESKLEHAAKNPEFTDFAKRNLQDSALDVVIPTLGNLWLSKAWKIGLKVTTPDEKNTRQQLWKNLEKKGPKLHSLRKEIKRARYRIELFGEKLKPESKLVAKDLSNAQEVLGNLQDFVIQYKFLVGTLGKNKLNKRIPKTLGKLEMQVLDHIERWEQLRQNQLTESYRLMARRNIVRDLLN